MNTIAASDSIAKGLLAAFAAVPAPNAAQATPGFLHLMSAVFTAHADFEPAITDAPGSQSAAPRQIADALIRSMLSTNGLSSDGLRAAPQAAPAAASAGPDDAVAENGETATTRTDPIPQGAPMANPPALQQPALDELPAPAVEPAVPAAQAAEPSSLEPAPPAPGLPAGNRAAGGATQAPRPRARKSKDSADGRATGAPPAGPVPTELPVRLNLNQTAVAPAQLQAVAQTERARSAGEMPAAPNNPAAAAPPPANDPVFSKTPLAFSAELTPTAASARNTPAVAQPVSPPAAAMPEASPAPELTAAPEAQPIEKPVKASPPQESDPVSDAGVTTKSALAPRDAPVRAVAAAAASSNANDFTRGFAEAAPPPIAPGSAGNQTATPFAAAADAVRNSEPAAPAPAALAGAPVQEIAVRIAQPEAPAVDLHVSERGGEIHVAVRTADARLQTSLREDLGTLTTSLERAGYHAETFIPGAAAPQSAAQMNSREDRQASQQGSGRGGSQSDSSQSRQQQGQQRQRPQSGPDWLEELENLK